MPDEIIETLEDFISNDHTVLVESFKNEKVYDEDIAKTYCQVSESVSLLREEIRNRC